MKPAESWSLIAFEVAAVRQSGERPAAAAAGYRIGRRPCRSFGGFAAVSPPVSLRLTAPPRQRGAWLP
ncbi:hypothetical protein BL105A_1861 [Bifidobacterium longum]|nr:hypothetical protein BL105A_1861 [Bifidobacterium longum]